MRILFQAMGVALLTHSARMPAASADDHPNAVPALRDLPGAPVQPDETSARLGRGILRPRPRIPIVPRYPDSETGDAIVVVQFVVDEDGFVSDAQALSGPEGFRESALEAIYETQFDPARVNGKRTRARVRSEVRFVSPHRAFTTQETPPEPAGPNSETPRSSGLEVTVTGVRKPPTAITLTAVDIRQTPGTFGDAFRSIESLPGVTPTLPGLPFFYLRGAPPGNVGYFIDGIRVPTLFHLQFGPSVVNSALIAGIDVYPSAYPVEFGRFAGGVVSARTVDAELSKNNVNLRLIDAGGMLTHSFGETVQAQVAGRYSYTGLLISLVSPGLDIGYWDYQVKARYRVSSASSLTVFALGGGDHLRKKVESGTQRDRLDIDFHRLDMTYSFAQASRTSYEVGITLGYDFTVDNSEEEEDPVTGELLDGPRLEDRSIRVRATAKHVASDSFTARLGGDVQRDAYLIQAPPSETDPRLVDRDDIVAGAFVEAAWSPEPWIHFVPGARVDSYWSSEEQKIAPEPRVASRFDVSESLSLTNGVGVAHQAPGFIVPIPGIPTTGLDGTLQRAVQHVSGFVYSLTPAAKLSANAFHSIFFNLTDRFSELRETQEGTSTASSGSEPTEPDAVHEPPERSLGRSAGLELMVKRRLVEGWGGFLAYTLSRSTQSSGRVTRPSSYDRTHVIQGALAYDIGRNWLAGGRVSVFSGIPARSAISEIAANPPRAPWSKRVDLRLEKRWPLRDENSWWSLVFEVYNASFSKDVNDYSCDATECSLDETGPIVIPNVALEGRF